jgi:hypothetical protein
VTQLAPSKPQLVRRLIDQPSDLALDLGQLRVSRPVAALAAATGKGRRLARVLASRSVGV